MNFLKLIYNSAFDDTAMSPVYMIVFTLCGFILLTLQTLGFNVQTRNVNIIVGPNGSQFGFTASFLNFPDTDGLG